jgi:streptogramin lyase
MLKRRIVTYLSSLIVVVGGIFSASSMISQSGAAGTVISGTVRTTDGKPLEGVGVSARRDHDRFRTTVYTNQDGAYLFPPLTNGRYRVWAQAVGFDASAKEAALADANKASVNLTLTQIQDFQKQLSGTEWVASLRDDNPGDLRMKAVFTSNCIGCHTASFPLQNRFDAAGWRSIMNVMLKIQSIGIFTQDATPDGPIKGYEDELARYLGRVRGPESALDLKPLPRPTGEATQVIITEYDLPQPGMPEWIMEHNGTDWSEGTPSRWDGRAAHDVAIDQKGYVWFTDDATPGRTLGRLDPHTGNVTDFALTDQTKSAESSHALVLDSLGNVWFSNGIEGNPTEFDPRTEKFQRFPRPAEFPFSGDFITIDGEGNLWSPHKEGAYKLDPHTGKYTNYASGLPDKANYDIAVDRHGNAWIAQPGGNQLSIVDAETGKVDILPLTFRTDVETNDKDRQIFSSVTLTANTGTPLEKGPRRIAADRNGDVVWACEFFADQLAKIDINTHKVTEYRLPHRYSQPYAVTVDQNHMVWISMLSSDRIARFDPQTASFTEFEIPTLGTEIRHIQADASTNPPTVWVPEDRTNKIARIQFRTGSETR